MKQVKLNVLKRLSFLLGVNVINNVALNSTVGLTAGVCPKYSVDYFTLANENRKSLISVSGESMSNGCSMILRGGTFSELIRVKRIVKRLLLVEYHGRAERHFLQDVHAKAPDDDEDGFSLTNMTLSPFIKFDLKRFMRPIVRAEICPEEQGKEVKTWDEAQKRKQNEFIDDPNFFLRSPKDRKDALTNFRANLKHFDSEAQPPKMNRYREVMTAEDAYKSWVYNNCDLRPLRMLFSQHLPKYNQYCIEPWTVTIGLYGERDLPLGVFLTDHCFNDKAHCQSFYKCGNRVVHHVRRFCHGNLAVILTVQEMKEAALPFTHEDEVTMWKYCLKCKIVTPFGPLKEPVYWLSYAAFLLFSFHEDKLVRRGRTSEMCDHKLSKDHVTIFAKGKKLATFCAQEIDLYRIVFPEIIIEPPNSNSAPKKEDLEGQMSALVNKGAETFSSILEKISAEKALINEHEIHYAEFKELLNSAQSHLQAGDKSASKKLIFKASRYLIDQSNEWRSRLGNKDDHNNEGCSSSAADLMSGGGEKNPFGSNLHFELHPAQSIVVDEKQPSSIIAYTLGSREYLSSSY